MKILMIGPFPEPVTGESLANLGLYEFLNDNRISVKRINTATSALSSRQGKFQWFKVWGIIKSYLAIVLIPKTTIIYITPGQTFLGILKYAPFIIFSKILLKPIIFHIHGGGLAYSLNRENMFSRKSMQFLISLGSAGIVLSRSLQNNFRGSLPMHRVFEVNNFAPAELFSVELKDKNFSNLNVLYLSNLMIEKGILDLIEAFVQLKENHLNINLTLAGKIEDDHHDLIYSKIIKSGVKYVGSVYGDEKVNLFKSSNVFILPTYYKTEGQPISILEAMVSGNLIVTTRHSGIPDIISEENGCFVDIENPKSIYECLTNLSKNMQIVEKKSKFNYYDSREKYRVENFGTKILKIFKNCNNLY